MIRRVGWLLTACLLLTAWGAGPAAGAVEHPAFACAASRRFGMDGDGLCLRFSPCGALDGDVLQKVPFQKG